MAWDKFQREAEKIEVKDPSTATQKMQKLQLAMNLRRRLRERFHTRGVDTPDYTKWIAKVETDTRQLADALLSMSHPPLHCSDSDAPSVPLDISCRKRTR